jgi:serine/threonine-protein kinase
VSDLTGELIDGRYQLQKLIASGGMASIYSASDLRLDRSVAVKIMHAHLANDEDFVNRFIREAKATAALSHPNIVAIQDQGWNEGGVPAVFIVMELIDGFTLRDVLNERGALPPMEAIRYLSPIVSALAAAHKIGIIHRDVKPENILISTEGRIKIADFGLARGAEIGATMTVESSVILGSVSYLSPEQVQRGISDSRSDIYALGIVLFEMLTGQKPFEGESPIQIAYKHVNERVPAPSTIKADIPGAIDAIVEKATNPNPDSRYAHAGELQLALQKAAQELDPARRQLSLELDIPVQLSSKTKTKMSKKKEESVAKKTSTTAPVRRKRKTSARVKRNRAIALFILIALVGGGWYQFLGPGSQVGIPSVVGLSASDAATSLTPMKLTTKIVSKVFSEDVPAGRVISSNPGGGGYVAPGGVVELTISKGPERIVVPMVSGMTIDSATVALEAAGLKIGNTSEINDATIDVGMIVETDPPIGAPAKRNSLVNVRISKGPLQVTSTSYAGMSSDQALSELTDKGFVVKSKYVFDDNVPAGSVVSQSPDGKTPIDKGATITLTISKGPSGVYVPNLYSLTQAKATLTLENMGLKVKVKKIGAKKIKTVTNVSPAVGTKVPVGSVVTITVS